MSNSNPADQHQNLIAQQSSLLAAKAVLLEQLEATDKNLAAVRAALEGAKIGYAVAGQEAAAKAAAEADAEASED